MPEIIIPNMEDAEIFSAQLDPGAGYLFNIQELPKVIQAKTGTTQLEVTFTVISGPDQKVTNPETGTLSPTGKKIKDFIAFTAQFRMKQLLVACGLLARDDKTSEMAKGKFNSDILLGQKCGGSIEAEMYQEKERRRIKYAI